MKNRSTIHNLNNHPIGPSDHVDGRALRKFLKWQWHMDNAKRSMKFDREKCLRRCRRDYGSHDCCRAHRNLNFIFFQLQYWAAKTHFSKEYGLLSEIWRARVGIPLSSWVGDDFPWEECPPLPVVFQRD